VLFCSDVERIIESMEVSTLGLVPQSPTLCFLRIWIRGPLAMTPWPPWGSRPAG
jgi:hypothetical protein